MTFIKTYEFSDYLIVGEIYTKKYISETNGYEVRRQSDNGDRCFTIYWEEDKWNEYFITLSEYREEQINEIIND